MSTGPKLFDADFNIYIGNSNYKRTQAFLFPLVTVNGLKIFDADFDIYTGNSNYKRTQAFWCGFEYWHSQQ